MDEKEMKDIELDEMKDSLTGIWNRKGFYKYTRELLDDHPDLQFCLIYWNICRFKVVNELFGQETGDKVLMHLADSLRKEFGNEIATYGRIEGDNFICCVQDEVIQRGDWKNLSDNVYYVEDSEYHFFNCCGLYRIKNRELSISNMVDKARVAMESVKNNYMSPYAWYEESMWDSIVEEQKLNSGFKKAIANKEFKVYYQPICRATDGLVTSAEALVRWEQPGKGLISPGAFIPLFEKNGFISMLDRYVWDEVCRLQRERLDLGLKTVPISVNVSRVEFYNPALCEDIWNIVKKYDIPTELIKIEITESAYSDNPEQVQAAVKRLHEYGFIVLMDDFGSGYSSLNILKDLPIDVLKIDMKFMNDFEKSQKAAVILEAVIRMAKWMKLQVVSEGIETRKEWDYLKSVECDLVQGFYFYKPMPEEAFMDLLNRMEPGGGGLSQDNLWEMDDATFNMFASGDSLNSMMFYSMIGGLGVLEMSGDSLEIIQVNKGYYEVLYGLSGDMENLPKNINKEVEEPSKRILMEKCLMAKEQGKLQQVQVHHKKDDGIYIWLNVKLRYVGSNGKRSLFCFAIDDIDEMKKAEQERYFSNYSAALLKVFDKVYRLDYSTGMAEVLHAGGKDEMKAHEKYYFLDFFDRFEKYLIFSNGKKVVELIKDKDLLDKKLEKSKSGTYTVNYKVENAEVKVKEVSALFFKVELQDGQPEYLCCIKTHI